MNNWINSWKAKNKQKDKFQIEIRLGRLTVLELNIDISKKLFRILVFNFGYENNGR